MIAKAKSISHGINAINYMAGMSDKKTHPEKIEHVLDQHLDPFLDTLGIWNEMKHATMSNSRMEKNVIRIEISPSPEYAKDFSLEEWQALWKDFAKEFDSIELKDKKGKIISCKTNISESKATVWLHEDSKSNIPHLHAAVCRMDENGVTNNDHKIHLRAQIAAERVALKRGWQTAHKVRTDNKKKITQDCLEILMTMKEFSLDQYFSLLEKRGYQVNKRIDKTGTLRGYSLKKGKVCYKASELGKGRNLMVTKIIDTWKRLHPELDPKFDYTISSPGRTKIDLWYKNNRYIRFIPDATLSHLKIMKNQMNPSNSRALLDRALYNIGVKRSFLSHIASILYSLEGGTGENREYEVSSGNYDALLEYEIAKKAYEDAVAIYGIAKSRSIGW